MTRPRARAGGRVDRCILVGRDARSGDEFAVLMPETTGPAAEIGVQRLEAACRSTAVDPVAAIEVSCGFATVPEEGVDAGR